MKKVIDINFKNNPELYTDYEACLEFLEDINNSSYDYPSEVTNFHVYTEIKTPKELMVIKSFLATQNLEHTKLTVWSDYDISDNELIQPYKNYVEFRVYDPIEEAKGTPLEDHWYLNLKDPKYYLQSDLARMLLLWKYGGVWADMDIIFLRDFKPILDQEYMYMWGSETDFANQGACATVLAGKPNSDFMNELIIELKETGPTPGTTCWGKDLFAKLYRRFEYNIFPASFFNIEWCINKKHPGHGDEIEKGWFLEKLKDEKYLFLQSFAWHWHNSSKKDYVIAKGSKFDLLEKLTDKKLQQKEINGRY